jgi:hypothetical protein
MSLSWTTPGKALSDGVRFRARNTGGQVFPVGNPPTPIAYDIVIPGEVFPQGTYDIETFTWTCPLCGHYLIHAAVGLQGNVAPTDEMHLDIVRDGITFQTIDLKEAEAVVANNTTLLSGVTLVELNPGQTIQARFFNTGSTQTSLASALLGTFSIGQFLPS